VAGTLFGDGDYACIAGMTTVTLDHSHDDQKRFDPAALATAVIGILTAAVLAVAL
jgi:hypothetical protein